MVGTIAITDEGWYEFLRERPDLSEVNFWRPSARRAFRAPEFSPFLFKLKAPHNAVCGFAFFAAHTALPTWLAWETFGEGNGCGSRAEMEARLESIRARIRYRSEGGVDFIGCTLLVQPIFFPREGWIKQPQDWKARTQTSASYDLSQGEGRRIWEACQGTARNLGLDFRLQIAEEKPRYGTPILVSPRLGQGTFRIAVTDAYGRACAITGEHSLPALQASHIKPFAQGGPHLTTNGLLLRADLHRLFDLGYITIDERRRVLVSQRLRTEFQNGRTYYPLNERPLRVPKTSRDHPDPELLRWHSEHVFAA